MTEPTDKRTDRPVMGDHPDLEDAEVQRHAPVRGRDRLSPLYMAGIIALVLLVVLIIILAVV